MVVTLDQMALNDVYTAFDRLGLPLRSVYCLKYLLMAVRFTEMCYQPCQRHDMLIRRENQRKKQSVRLIVF